MLICSDYANANCPTKQNHTFHRLSEEVPDNVMGHKAEGEKDSWKKDERREMRWKMGTQGDRKPCDTNLERRTFWLLTLSLFVFLSLAVHHGVSQNTLNKDSFIYPAQPPETEKRANCTRKTIIWSLRYWGNFEPAPTNVSTMVLSLIIVINIFLLCS